VQHRIEWETVAGALKIRRNISSSKFWSGRQSGRSSACTVPIPVPYSERIESLRDEERVAGRRAVIQLFGDSDRFGD